VFRELWLFANKAPSQLSLVYTQELERVTNMHASMWETDRFSFANIVRLNTRLQCETRLNPGHRCPQDAITACSTCKRARCISHMPCSHCVRPQYVRVLVAQPAFPSAMQIESRGVEKGEMPYFLNRPRPSLEKLPRFRFYIFAQLGDSDLHRRIRKWKANIDALPTSADAPPLSRAFDYVKHAPGVWLADVSDVLYPFQAIRTTLNHSFPPCGYDGSVWNRNVDFLLTCADHDEIRRHAFNIVVWVRGMSQRSNTSFAYLVPRLVAFLMPCLRPAEERNVARLDNETARYASTNAQGLHHPKYRWLTQYYTYFPDAFSVPRLRNSVSFSLLEPIRGPRLQRLVHKIQFYATTGSLPLMRSAPPGLVRHDRRRVRPRGGRKSGKRR
jgi:hypothetical protein